MEQKYFVKFGNKITLLTLESRNTWLAIGNKDTWLGFKNELVTFRKTWFVLQ